MDTGTCETVKAALYRGGFNALDVDALWGCNISEGADFCSASACRKANQKWPVILSEVSKQAPHADTVFCSLFGSPLLALSIIITRRSVRTRPRRDPPERYVIELPERVFYRTQDRLDELGSGGPVLHPRRYGRVRRHLGPFEQEFRCLGLLLDVCTFTALCADDAPSRVFFVQRYGKDRCNNTMDRRRTHTLRPATRMNGTIDAGT